MSGRKQQSAVWKYFSYEPSTGKSRCNIEDCGVLLIGKNATNLKTHLNSKHKNIFNLISELDKPKASNSRKLNEDNGIQRLFDIQVSGF